MGQLTQIAPGVLVATSSFAMTTTTVVAGAPGLPDSGVLIRG